MYEELSYKFANLANLKPDGVKSKFRLFENVLKDDFVHNINPSRYRFYIQFMKGLKDPNTLKKVIYENKLIKYSKEEEAQIINKIAAKLNQLYALPANIDDNILNNDHVYSMYKNDYMNREKDLLNKRMSKILDTYDWGNNKEEIMNISKETFRINDKKRGGGKPIKVGDDPVSKVQSPENKVVDQKNDLDINDIKPYDEMGKNPQNYELKDRQNDFGTNLKNEGNAGNKDEYLSDLFNETENNNETQINNNKNVQVPPKDKKVEFEDNLFSDIYIPPEDNKESKTPPNTKNPDSSKIEEAVRNEDSGFNDAYSVLNDRIKQNKMDIANLKSNDQKTKEKYLENMKLIKEKFKKDGMLHNYRNKLKKILDAPSTDNRIKASKLNDILVDIENNEYTSINNIKVSKEDKLIFIGITFIIRLITLVIIDWALNTNFIVTFTQAYLLFVIMYCLLVLLIVVVVNITYNYPYMELFLGKHNLFTSMASSLYYFYLIPGYVFSNSFRFVIHFGIIISITATIIIIKELENKRKGEDNDKLQYDYAEKKFIKRNISNFTLLMWIFTSIVAMYTK